MIRKTLVATFIAIALAIGFVRAQTFPVQTGTITATGTTVPLPIAGDNSVCLQATGAGTMTVTFQGASDNVPTFNNITGETAVAITAPVQLCFGADGTGANQAPAALAQIRMNVTVYGGTPIPYTLSATTALIGTTEIIASMPPVAISQPTSASGAINTTNCDPTTAAQCANVKAAVGDGSTTGAALSGQANDMVFNGATWDRQRSVAGSVGIQNVAISPVKQTKLSAVVTTCTSINTTASVLVYVAYASSAAQTGTLQIYNEGASPTCAAADVIYTSAAHAAATIPEVQNIVANAGIAYEWTTAAEVQNVYAGTTP